MGKLWFIYLQIFLAWPLFKQKKGLDFGKKVDGFSAFFPIFFFPGGVGKWGEDFAIGKKFFLPSPQNEMGGKLVCLWEIKRF